MVLQRRETRIISDDGRFERAFSMKIWQLKIPNKVEIFAWKTCSYILPVRSNLIDKRCKEFSLQIDVLALGLFFFTGWSIWYNRNDWVFNKKSQSAEEVARYVADYLQGYTDTHTQLKVATPVQRKEFPVGGPRWRIEGDSFNYGYDVCTTKGFVEHAVPALGECVTLCFKAIQFTNNSQPKNIGRKDVSG
ncbi:unnamed protein product [Camellia sinensis]